MKVKAYIPQGTEFLYDGNDYPYETQKEHWTTIEVSENDYNNDRWIQHLAKDNLVKKIAQIEMFNIKLWKYIWLDSVDIKVVRSENKD